MAVNASRGVGLGPRADRGPARDAGGIREEAAGAHRPAGVEASLGGLEVGPCPSPEELVLDAPEDLLRGAVVDAVALSGHALGDLGSLQPLRPAGMPAPPAHVAAQDGLAPPACARGAGRAGRAAAPCPGWPASTTRPSPCPRSRTPARGTPCPGAAWTRWRRCPSSATARPRRSRALRRSRRSRRRRPCTSCGGASRPRGGCRSGSPSPASS